ncbi:ATP-binding protein [Mahella australiensis]|uniref:Helicase HerA central domain-containing protein n=1 Tax=Mahella australiensis (strain DSM 15567 / CIP 107919 / 50-1 BON) TaxID=697281 RepID=F4A3C5_MAHA5|nr:ATP-binding protein [Mahella australiensis]AEE97380.1 hypothetical protein Mahau_2209 [Mahella australiensis 50-1 BON]
MIQVVGLTTQQEVWVASKDKPFRINQMLIIEDQFQGPQRGEVVETNSYNRFIPLNINGGGMVDASILESLKQLGYNIGQDTIHLAKVRLVVEAQYPIQTGCAARTPRFDEVSDLMVTVSPQEGLILGVIKSSDEVAEDMPPGLKDIALLYEGGKARPQNGVPFIFDIKAMQQYPHIGVFGGSGSGKSFGMRVMLEELMKLRIPVLVLDPHLEMDFSTRASGLPDGWEVDYSANFRRLNIGQDIGVAFDKLSNADLKNLLGASSPLSESMANAVETLHKRSDSYQTFSDRLDMLDEALEDTEAGLRAKLESADNQYQRQRYEQCIELRRTYRDLPLASVRAISWRLRRLFNDGLFSHDIQPVEEGLKQGKLMVIQGSSQMINVFGTYLLNNLYHKRRDYKDAQARGMGADYFPPFIVVADEAHNFAPKGYDTPAKTVLKEIAQEGRKYGTFLILATQRPTSLDENITAQLNTKLVFRTVRSIDIATIKEETDITLEEARRLPYLPSGDAFVSSAIIGRTVPIRVRMARTASPHNKNPFDELKDIFDKQEQELLRYIEDKLPIYDADMLQKAAEIERDSNGAYTFTVDQLKDLLDRLVQQGRIIGRNSVLGYIYDKPEGK